MLLSNIWVIQNMIVCGGERWVWTSAGLRDWLSSSAKLTLSATNSLSASSFYSVVDNTPIEHMDVYIGSKKWACRTCDLIANVRLNKRVKTALEVFESDLNNGKKLGEPAVADEQVPASAALPPPRGPRLVCRWPLLRCGREESCLFPSVCLSV